MREVVEKKLWIGHAGDLRDLRVLAECEIEVVVELAYDEAPATLPRSMIVCRFPLLDGEGNSPTILEAAVDAVYRFLSQGVPVLVACGVGMSRSPGVAAMGLAQWKQIEPDDALRKISQDGPIDLHPELWSDLKKVCLETKNDKAKQSIGFQSVESAINAFRGNKRLADNAISQVSDEKLRVPLNDDLNSVAVIMKHIAGNLRSRWTNFLSTDGEKPNRQRDGEFVDDYVNREAMLADWENGWECLFSTLEALSVSDLEKTITIRGEPHSVLLAISRSLGHTCYHIGQIVQLARHYVGDDWNVLTIPRGKSEEFNRQNWGSTGKSHS